MIESALFPEGYSARAPLAISLSQHVLTRSTTKAEKFLVSSTRLDAEQKQICVR